MTALHVPPRHRGGVWIFGVDLPDHALEYFRSGRSKEAPGAQDHPLADALGLPRLDAGYVELFDANMMKDYGLMRYLSEANGMNPATLNPADAPIDTVSGPVLLVFAKALPEGTEVMTPKPPLNFIAHMAPDQALPDLHPFPDSATIGHIAPGGGAPAAIGRGWILPALLIAAVLLAGLIVWGLS